jgi:X-Pro dipeptidyl-peptidase
VAPAQQTTQGLSEPIYTQRITEVYRVDTPRGVIYGEVIRPVVPEGVKVPVILTYSPYNILGSPANQAGSIADDGTASYFVPRGYARAVFDVVGTRESSGCYDYGGLGERETGAAVVDHLGAQPWANGKVGMIGGSYDGTTQWAAAVQQPKHLVALIPQVAIDRWYDYAYGGGIRYLLNSENPTDEGFDTPLAFDFGFGFIPPLDASGPQYAEALATRIHPCGRLIHTERGYEPNPVYGAFWEERDYRRLAHTIKAAALIEGGWLDHNVKHWDSTRMFMALPADHPKRLVMGQWRHSASRFDDAQAIRHAWFDYWLLDLPTGVMDLPAVDSEASDGVRRQDDQWPPTGTEAVTLSLDGSSAAALTLRNASSATFLDNPLLTEEQIFSDESCANACLLFTGEPLSEALRISGSPQLHLAGRIDTTATHYTPVLYEESAAGAVSIITRGFLNLRNRNGLHVSEPVSAGQAWTATVDLWDTDYVVPAGHRLGVAVMSSNAIWALPDVTLATTTLDLGATSLELPVSEGHGAVSAEARSAVRRFGGAIGVGLLVLGFVATRYRANAPRVWPRPI